MKNSGQEFEWSFPGGIPSSSSFENPLVYYANPGNYDVTLTVNDSNGSDSQTISNLITYEDLSLSDINEMEEQPGEKPTPWMSLYKRPKKHQKQLSCFITRTNKTTHNNSANHSPLCYVFRKYSWYWTKILPFDRGQSK